MDYREGLRDGQLCVEWSWEGGDGADGTPLITTEYFETPAAAEAWISRDLALRAAQTPERVM